MQASECSFNTKYPKKPNGITDPEYSISCGIQYLKSALTAAGVQNPVDMDRIKLALQGYNFGVGYISWALENYGGYSKAGAVELSLIHILHRYSSSFSGLQIISIEAHFQCMCILSWMSLQM